MRQSIQTICRRLASAGVALAAVFGGPAAAQETINLTAVSGYSPVVTWTREFRAFFIPEVNKRLASKYKINWNEAYGGQIANPGGELQAIQRGLADIGIVVIPFHTDKIGLYAINFYTPFVVHDVVVAQKAVDRMVKQFPAMAKQWEPLNQVFLASFGVVDDYQIVVRKPVKAMDDFKGLKIGGSGANILWLQAMGATGVQTNLAEAYNNIKSGVMDGMIIHTGGARNVKLFEVAPYHVNANLGAVTSFTVNVNAATWKRLPADVRTTLQEVAAAYAEHTAIAGRADTKLGLEAYKEANGTFVDVSDATRRAWAKNMPNIAKRWAEDHDKQGLPGTQVLAAYMDAMRAEKQPVLRNWDKE